MIKNCISTMRIVTVRTVHLIGVGKQPFIIHLLHIKLHQSLNPKDSSCKNNNLKYNSCNKYIVCIFELIDFTQKYKDITHVERQRETHLDVVYCEVSWRTTRHIFQANQQAMILRQVEHNQPVASIPILSHNQRYLEP
ncbi:hypothetical protein HanPI659440_Chr01g0006711 [Helianthus annuus]|nr:hypothetical protein HanPI659440_Chr01g0006711 [Helianthus annuus]